MTHPAFEDVNTGYGYLTYVNAAENWSWPTSTADTYCAPYGQWPSYPHRPFFESAELQRRRPGERQQRYDIAHTFASGTGGQKFIVYRGVDMVIAIRNGAVSADDGGTVVDQFPGHKTVWNAVRPAMLAVRSRLQGRRGRLLRRLPPQRVRPGPARAVVQGVRSRSLPARAAPCTSRRVLRITIRKPRGMKVRKVSVAARRQAGAGSRGKRITRRDRPARPRARGGRRAHPHHGTRRGRPATSPDARVPDLHAQARRDRRRASLTPPLGYGGGATEREERHRGRVRTHLLRERREDRRARHRRRVPGTARLRPRRTRDPQGPRRRRRLRQPRARHTCSGRTRRGRG